MKFLHLGDLHIGKYLGDYDLIPDQEYILNKLYDIAMEQKVDGVIIAGDVYDKQIPSEAAVRLFDKFLCRLSDSDVKTFLISGNHDSDERLNFASSLLTTKGVYISAKYDGTLYKQTFTDEFGPVNVFLMPFVKATRVKRYHPEDEMENTYDEAVKVLLSHGDINPAERNILVAHQFVTGKSEDPAFGGSESVSTRNVGLVEKIGYDCFDAFDYVALGHIHSAQEIGRAGIRYSGSPLKYSLSEAESKKYATIVTIEEKGKVNVELLDLKPMRDLRHIRGKLHDLLNEKVVVDSQDFIYATLTDEDYFDDVMNYFRQYYPNTVKIEYDNSHTKVMDGFEAEEFDEEKPVDVTMADFYKQIYGCEISEDELKVMMEVAKEAGIIDETN